MRIAQVSPLFERVPPVFYGGTERVVSYLTDELVRQGHEVTLFASGDSLTKARLVAGAPRSLRLDTACRDSLAPHLLLLERVAAEAARFDVIHYHVDYLHFPFSRRLSVPHLTTLHGRLDLPDLQPVFREYSDMPLASISNAQRQPLPFAMWQATVHHGLPPALYSFRARPGGYLAFIGRISPEKGVDRAIEIARRSNLPIRIAAKIDKVDRAYFDADIAPLLDQPGVEFLGEIGEAQKSEFLGGAKALLFPIDWPEPFGLAMIEAMACGTPVVAFPRGSVAEIIEPGITGFIVHDVDQAVRAVRRIDAIDRRGCRERFERRFSVERMACQYLTVYRRLLASHHLAAS